MEGIPNNKVEGSIGSETSFYEINPKLHLVKEGVDVSYNYNSEHFQRNMDLYEDELGNTWFEVKDQPKKQMMISLLAQPFFNISTVIETKIEKNGVKKILKKINPEILTVFGSSLDIFDKKKSSFFSKKINFENIPEKEKEEIISDYIIFGSVFNLSNNDIDFNKQHNFRKEDNKYALFDFGSSSVEPQKYFDPKKCESVLKDYIDEIKFLLYPLDGFKARDRDLPAEIVNNMLKKLNELKVFFDSDEGRNFFESVFNKSGFETEINEKINDPAFLHYGDTSFANPDELYKGLVIKIKTTLEDIQNKIKT